MAAAWEKQNEQQQTLAGYRPFSLSPTQEGGALTNLTPQQVWDATKNELQLQMTKATFNSWLADAQLVSPQTGELNGRMVIGVRNEYAQQWLQARLDDTIKRTMQSILGRPLDIQYVVATPGWSAATIGEPPEMPPAEGYRRPTEPGSGEYGGNLSPQAHTELLERIKAREETDGHTTAVFPGFEPLNSNWTQVPDMFFTFVVPNAHAIVTKLVGTVIHQTLGHFEDKKRNHRRDEWPANHAVVQRKAGIASKTSLQTALWDARAEGYIILRPLEDEEEKRSLSKKVGYTCHYTLRIRYPDDAIDTPHEPRPGYGNKQK